MRKLYNVCLMVVFLLSATFVYAQKTPYFYFKKRVYTDDFTKNYLKSLKVNEIKLPESERLAIALKALKHEKFKDMSYIKRSYLNGKSESEGAYPRYWVMDFNKDKKPDIVMIYNTYFGPSPGYFYFFINKKGQYEYILDGMGEIYVIASSRQRTVIQHDLGKIDSKETEIIRTIDIDHRKRTFEIFPKLYYASQTVLPEQINQRPRLVKMKKNSALRFSPQVMDTLIKDPNKSEYEYGTQTLKGNIVAQYGVSAQAYQLAIKGKWVFVAFLPKTKQIKTSLLHGMDTEYDPKTAKQIGPKRKPYTCGWIQKSDIK